MRRARGAVAAIVIAIAAPACQGDASLPRSARRSLALSSRSPIERHRMQRDLARHEARRQGRRAVFRFAERAVAADAGGVRLLATGTDSERTLDRHGWAAGIGLDGLRGTSFYRRPLRVAAVPRCTPSTSGHPTRWLRRPLRLRRGCLHPRRAERQARLNSWAKSCFAVVTTVRDRIVAAGDHVDVMRRTRTGVALAFDRAPVTRSGFSARQAMLICWAQMAMATSTTKASRSRTAIERRPR